jgi:hypothetical protein
LDDVLDVLDVLEAADVTADDALGVADDSVAVAVVAVSCSSDE